MSFSRSASDKLKHLRNTMKQHPRWTLTIIGTILISIAGGTTYAILSRPMPELPPIPAAKPKPVVKYYSPLTGKQVGDEAATKQSVTAVMIENSPDARPQSGLKEAGIVFEAVAEGGITRFAALYQEDKPKIIGPVRSLRPYYLDWVAGFDASIAHVGGSPEALREVRNGKYRDIDQFFNAGAYWRSTDRYAPHNVYTNSKRLDALNKQKGYKSSTFTGFAREEGKAVAEPDASKITVSLSGPLYDTGYAYNAKTNTYARSLAGVAHNDREKGQITPSVVVALKVNQATGYYRNIKTISSGEAIIFQNGTAIKATWSKESRKGPLQFKDTDGNDVALNRGQTWIVAVGNGQGNISWQ